MLRLPAVERLEVSDTARSLVDTSRVVVEESKQRKEEELRVAKELAAEQQRRAEEHRAAATRERRNVKILTAHIGCRARDCNLGNYRGEKGGQGEGKRTSGAATCRECAHESHGPAIGGPGLAKTG